MRNQTFLSSFLIFFLCLAIPAIGLNSYYSSLLDRAYSVPQDYIKSAHPCFEEGKPTDVYFDFHLKGIPRVDLKKQEIEVDMVLGLTWDEPRLKDFKNNPNFESIKTYEFDPNLGNYIFFPGDRAKELWIPDIYLDKTPNIRNPIYMLDASSIRLYVDDSLPKVRFMTQLNFDTHCEMNFRFYPFDKQECSINVESFGQGENDIDLFWRVKNIVDQLEVNKADSGGIDTMEQYHHKVELVKMRYLEEGEYFSRLVLKIIFTRKLPYFIVNLYIPSILLATIAYCSLYLPPTSKVPRIGMTLVTLLAVNTMINGIKAEMPRVTYITMSDAWLYPITYYCCFCLFEFLVVQHLVEVEKENAAKLTEFWSRVIFAVLPIVWFIGYGIAAVVGGYGWVAVRIEDSEIISTQVM